VSFFGRRFPIWLVLLPICLQCYIWTS
jgi:hypothetical protein